MTSDDREASDKAESDESEKGKQSGSQCPEISIDPGKAGAAEEPVCTYSTVTTESRIQSSGK